MFQNKTPQTGIWTYTQIIKLIVKDSSAYLQCPKDTIVDAKNDCKGLYVKLDSVKDLLNVGRSQKLLILPLILLLKGQMQVDTIPLEQQNSIISQNMVVAKKLNAKLKSLLKIKSLLPRIVCLASMLLLCLLIQIEMASLMMVW